MSVNDVGKVFGCVVSGLKLEKKVFFVLKRIFIQIR